MDRRIFVAQQTRKHKPFLQGSSSVPKLSSMGSCSWVIIFIATFAQVRASNELKNASEQNLQIEQARVRDRPAMPSFFQKEFDLPDLVINKVEVEVEVEADDYTAEDLVSCCFRI
jgi:hypothetical protein